MSVRVFSFGGGVQSTAVAVLVKRKELLVDTFIFANVGEDSENPETLRYVAEVVRPYLMRHNLSFVEVRKKGETLRETVMNPQRRSVVIPAYRRTERTTSIQRRNCTNDWKIEPVTKWISRRYTGQHVQVGLGISTDEVHRVRDRLWHDKDGRRKLGFWRQRWYPLIELNLSRQDCVAIIEKEGLPVPPKSSCYFCPFMRRAEWATLRAENPELFDKAVELETAMNNKGLEGVFRLHRTPSWLPLEEGIPTSTPLPLPLDTEEGGEPCDTGVCFT